MKWNLKRTQKQETETIGELLLEGEFFCYTCEDKDRGLNSEMDIAQIKEKKVYAKTAIPTGEYEIVISYSNRFKKLLPLLVGVKGFEGIRIHSGNTHKDTEGCILLGLEKSASGVLQSRNAMSQFMAVIQSAIEVEKVYINIE